MGTDLLGLYGLAGNFLVMGLVFLVIYVYFAYALMTIANKTKTKNSWLAWIPFANLYLMTQIAKLPWWWFLVALVASFIPLVGILVFYGLFAWWFWLIAERRGQPGWWGILMIIPFVNLVMVGLLAWKDK